MGVLCHVGHGPLLERQHIAGTLDLGVTPYDLAVPAVVEGVAQGESLAQGVGEAVVRAHVRNVIQTYVRLLAHAYGVFAGGHRISPALGLLFRGLGGEEHTALVVHQRGHLLVAVEKGAGGIDRYLGLEGGADGLGDASELVVGFDGEREVLVCLVEQPEYEVEAGIDVLAVHAHGLHVGVDGKALAYHGDGAPLAHQVEVVVGFEEACLRLPLFLLLHGHIRHLVDVLDQDVAAAYALVHAGPVVSIHFGCRLKPAGNLEIGIGDSCGGVRDDAAHEVPEFVAGEHRRVGCNVAVHRHVGVAGGEIALCRGTQVEGHVEGGDAVVRNHVQETVAGSQACQ